MYQLLIVDDEEDIRRGMARGIPWTSWGFEVAGLAENGEEAVRLVEERRPDVVLSDIRMPKMDGIELMQHLHDHYPEIKIIILSGYNDVEYLNMAIKNQVTEYLLKPTDIDEFEALFHRLKAGLDEEAEKSRELERLKESVEENKELFYDRVLNNMLDGYVGDSREYEWKRELEEAGLEFGHCMMVVMDTPDGAVHGEDHYRLKQKVIRYLNSRRMPVYCHFFLHRDRKIVGILSLSGGGANALPDRDADGERNAKEAITEAVAEIQGETADIYGLALLAGISEVCTEEGQLPEFYRRTEETVSSKAPDLVDSQKIGNQLVSSIRDYLDDQYCSNLLSLESAAEQFKKNPAYISKVFKKETGFNFSDYITQKRMAKSKELLKDMSLKIYEIAQMTGYADASNFIKVFKKHCGISPNEYRSLY